MPLKKGIRILALNGAPFSEDEKKELVIGIIGRNGIVEGSISFYVDVDGTDSTDRIIGRLKSSKFMDQVRVVAMNGITLAGLNIIDSARVAEELGAGIVAVTRKRPRRSLLKIALRGDPYRKEKVEVIERTYKRMEIRRINGFYVQSLNLGGKELEKVFVDAASFLRIAHIISSGIAAGESRGRI